MFAAAIIGILIGAVGVAFAVAEAVSIVRRVRSGCTCDPRFLDFAHDIRCPVHGLEAQLLTGRQPERWRSVA